jgi:hypothetical protein
MSISPTLQQDKEILCSTKRSRAAIQRFFEGKLRLVKDGLKKVPL